MFLTEWDRAYLGGRLQFLGAAACDLFDIKTNMADAGH